MAPYSDSRHETDMPPASVGSRRRPQSKAGAANDRRSKKKARRGNGDDGSPGWARELWEWTRTLLIAVAVVVLLHMFVFNLSTVEGHSMEPTLLNKEWLFVDKLSYRFDPPGRGDVIILRDPSEGQDKKEFLVKRIVGIPGDTIEIRGGQLYRNGTLVVEPYTDSDIQDNNYNPVHVEAGHYFVMGDNRHARASKDSRSFGTVPGNLILGRADMIIWPIADIHSL